MLVRQLPTKEKGIKAAARQSSQRPGDVVSAIGGRQGPTAETDMEAATRQSPWRPREIADTAAKTSLLAIEPRKGVRRADRRRRPVEPPPTKEEGGLVRPLPTKEEGVVIDPRKDTAGQKMRASKAAADQGGRHQGYC